MTGMPWDQRGRVKAGTSSRTLERAEQNGGGKESTNFWDFQVFHVKPQQRNWHICNDLQWHNFRPGLNPGLLHFPDIFPKFCRHQWSIGQTPSEIFIFLFFILFWGYCTHYKTCYNSVELCQLIANRGVTKLFKKVTLTNIEYRNTEILRFIPSILQHYTHKKMDYPADPSTDRYSAFLLR